MGYVDRVPREIKDAAPTDGADRIQVGWQPLDDDVGQTLSPVLGASIALDLRGGDVWAWHKRLTGTCSNCGPDTAIMLRVNAAQLPAERNGDVFAARVALEPGVNRVTAVLSDANGRMVESEPVIYTVRLMPRPTARLAMRLSGNTVVLDATPSEPSVYDGVPIERWAWNFRETNPVALEVIEDFGTVLVARSPAVDGEYFVSVTATDAAGRTDIAAAYFVVEDGAAHVPDPMTDEADWIERATVYGAIPFTFGEPGFNAVAERLDDLRDLGVAAIWLSPINRTLPGDFGYAVTDYFDVRQDYGTKEEFRALVRAAHARGIRVLMDFVPSHTSIQHPYVEDAEAYDQASPYFEFYDRDDAGDLTHYFHYVHLPNLNFDNFEVRTFITEALTSWVREFDVDGFRVDVAWGIRQRRPEFWSACNRELLRIKPDALLIAEASARDAYYVENGFHAAYDWTDKLGHWAWDGTLDDEAQIAKAMTAALTNNGRGYRPDSLILRFLNNNDTGPRFITTHGADFYRVASAMLLTLPGLPCVYSGDEVGAEFLPYDEQVAIDWTDRHGLRDHFKRLIALRAAHPSLHSRQWTPLNIEPGRAVFGYVRHCTAGELPPVLVLLNFSSDDVAAKVQLPAEFAGLSKWNVLTDLYLDEPLPVAAGDRLTIPLPAWAVQILTAPVGGR
ncbi:MAG: alpha-amylase family glycosyl hydrolase [Thermomicrobiales bacterium]